MPVFSVVVFAVITLSHYTVTRSLVSTGKPGTNITAAVPVKPIPKLHSLNTPAPPPALFHCLCIWSSTVCCTHTCSVSRQCKWRLCRL